MERGSKNPNSPALLRRMPPAKMLLAPNRPQNPLPKTQTRTGNGERGMAVSKKPTAPGPRVKRRRWRGCHFLVARNTPPLKKKEGACRKGRGRGGKTRGRQTRTRTAAKLGEGGSHRLAAAGARNWRGIIRRSFGEKVRYPAAQRTPFPPGGAEKSAAPNRPGGARPTPERQPFRADGHCPSGRFAEAHCAARHAGFHPWLV